jgi:hypothetical protein
MSDTPLSKKTIKVFITPTDTMDVLKTQLNKYIMYIGENHTTFHVLVQVYHVQILRRVKMKTCEKQFIILGLFVMIVT